MYNLLTLNGISGASNQAVVEWIRIQIIRFNSAESDPHMKRIRTRIS